MEIDLDRPFCMTCGKQAYPSEEAAKAAVRGHRHGGHNKRRRLSQDAYPCASGNGWHLTGPKRQPRT